jgi:hypothetical protein
MRGRMRLKSSDSNGNRSNERTDLIFWRWYGKLDIKCGEKIK